MLALPPARLFAAGFQGTPTGTGFNLVSGNLEITAPNAVINWSPDDQGTSGNIDFLPSAESVTFYNSTGNLGGYTVLNRVIPSTASRTIALNGTITSELRNAQGATTGIGGNIWFYAPGGILIGSGASIDVGGLALSTAYIGFAAPGSPTTGLVATAPSDEIGRAHV